MTCSKCGQQDMLLKDEDFGPEYEMKTAKEYVCADCRPVKFDDEGVRVEKCEYCDGTGVVECDMGHEHDCEDCE